MERSGANYEQLAYTWQGSDLLLSVTVQANASKDGWIRQQGGRWMVKIRAAASENRANQRLVHFLAEQFSVRQRHVILEQGARSRHKRLRVIAPRQLPSVLLIQLPNAS